MKDYYKILGVEKEASEEEIRAHWIELTKRYHPDLSMESDAEENIKKINEAYQVLKDKSTRLEYDLERIFKKKGLNKVRRWNERRINIRNIMLSAGILVFSLIVGLIIFRWFHIVQSPKPGVYYEIDKILEKKTPPQIPPVKTEPPLPPSPTLPSAEKESKPKEEFAPQVVTKQEAPIKVAREAPKEIPKENLKETPKEVTQITLQPGEKLESQTEKEKRVPREVGKVISQESAQVDKPKPTVMEPQPVQKTETAVKSERIISLPPSALVKEEEVRQFFSNYIDRYRRKDINGFVSLFSPRAIQNQKDGFEGIRNIYTKFFDQSRELRYHMEGMKIEIYQNSVEVRARYRLEQIFKKRGEEKVWKGDIRWVLVKEDGVLRIITLDYQNDKSP